MLHRDFISMISTESGNYFKTSVFPYETEIDYRFETPATTWSSLTFYEIVDTLSDRSILKQRIYNTDGEGNCVATFQGTELKTSRVGECSETVSDFVEIEIIKSQVYAIRLKGCWSNHRQGMCGGCTFYTTELLLWIMANCTTC
jgi:hypothetical protein